jgi:hypothetical protein
MVRKLDAIRRPISVINPVFARTIDSAASIWITGKDLLVP